MALAAKPDLFARLRADATLHTRLATREALDTVIAGTSSTLDPDTIAAFLVDWAHGWIPATSWAVVACERGTTPALLAASSLDEHGQRLALELAARAARQARHLYIPDLLRDPPVTPGRMGAVVAYVLIARKELTGVLVGIDEIAAAIEPRLDRRAEAAWESLLAPAAVALANSLALRRAEQLSVTDDLTGLYNLRFLNEALRREVKRAGRSPRPISVLFIDLDCFKAVNDTYDHLHGSRVLIEAATLLRGCARETDVVARFGGDEFVLILPETAAEGARAVADRIRERVSAHSFLATEGRAIRLTVSIGVATMPGAASSAHELLESADRAMYRAKAAGKNAIHVAATLPIT